jgi:hypothetical protein
MYALKRTRHVGERAVCTNLSAHDTIADGRKLRTVGICIWPKEDSLHPPKMNAITNKQTQEENSNTNTPKSEYGEVWAYQFHQPPCHKNLDFNY